MKKIYFGYALIIISTGFVIYGGKRSNKIFYGAANDGWIFSTIGFVCFAIACIFLAVGTYQANKKNDKKKTLMKEKESLEIKKLEQEIEELKKEIKA